MWYEPCVGEGAIVEAVNLHREAGSDPISWQLSDIRPEACAAVKKHWPYYELEQRSALDPCVQTWDEPSVVITNPPFNIAWELLHHLLKTFPHAHVVLLMRLNFLASDGRADFMRQFAPDVYVLPNRPSFRGGGKTDSIEYAWMHWSPVPRKREEGIYRVLPVTSLEERRQ